MNGSNGNYQSGQMGQNYQTQVPSCPTQNSGPPPQHFHHFPQQQQQPIVSAYNQAQPNPQIIYVHGPSAGQAPTNSQPSGQAAPAGLQAHGSGGPYRNARPPVNEFSRLLTAVNNMHQTINRMSADLRHLSRSFDSRRQRRTSHGRRSRSARRSRSSSRGSRTPPSRSRSPAKNKANNNHNNHGKGNGGQGKQLPATQ